MYSCGFPLTITGHKTCGGRVPQDRHLQGMPSGSWEVRTTASHRTGCLHHARGLRLQTTDKGIAHSLCTCAAVPRPHAAVDTDTRQCKTRQCHLIQAQLRHVHTSAVLTWRLPPRRRASPGTACILHTHHVLKQAACLKREKGLEGKGGEWNGVEWNVEWNGWSENVLEWNGRRHVRTRSSHGIAPGTRVGCDLKLQYL